MNLRDSDDWRHALAAANNTERKQRVVKLATAIPPEGVLELLGIVQGGAIADKQLAMMALVPVVRAHREALPERVRTECIESLLRLIRAEYPSAGLGSNAFEALRLIDSERLSRLVCDELDTVGLAAKDPRAVTRDLMMLKTPTAITRLRELTLQGGVVADQAESALEVLGVVSDQKLDRVAAEWRKKRTPDLLHKMHHLYTSRLDFGKATVKEVKAMLGDPDFEDSGMIAYAPNDGTALTLQKDRQGRVVGVHIT